MQGLTDTPPKIAEMVRAKLMPLSGPERFLMGARMFDAARHMPLASFPPDLSEPELSGFFSSVSTASHCQGAQQFTPLSTTEFVA
jgi:hypothetical protein